MPIFGSVQQAQAGMGRYYDVGTPVAKASEIRSGEANAQTRMAGIWATPACAPAPVAPQPQPEPEPEEDVYVPEVDQPNPNVPQRRSEGKPGCNPLTARDGDGDGIVCER